MKPNTGIAPSPTHCIVRLRSGTFIEAHSSELDWEIRNKDFDIVEYLENPTPLFQEICDQLVDGDNYYVQNILIQLFELGYLKSR